MSVTSWFLVSSSGTRHRLPREMIFVGRDDCELMLQSRSVDKQHAVINYSSNTDEHMVKDLGSLNGTFVNDLRIPDQTYITLKLSDVIRFGYDTHVYILEKSQHKVPEEALKHEKYTSQLQLSVKGLEAKTKEKQQLQSSEKSKEGKLQDRAERKAQSLTASTDTPGSKPTPLYGQPSWWGEDENSANPKKNNEERIEESPEPSKDTVKYEVNGSVSDSQAKSMSSSRQEPNYFEIPTKELQQQQPIKKPESQLHEVPTKDTSDPAHGIPSTPTPPVVQSHASFTIEFDDCTPGKMKIKDHVTKFAFRQQRKPPAAEVATTPTEVISAENKVADWLVQSNASLMKRRKSLCEDMYSTNSDPSMFEVAKEHRDDVNHLPTRDEGFNQSELHFSETSRAATAQHFSSLDSGDSPAESQSISTQSNFEPHQAFVIEFFDNSRKTRNNISPEPSGQEKTKSSSPSGGKQTPPTSLNTPPTQRYTIPLKDAAPSGFQRSGSLRREKTEDRISTGFSSRSSSSVPSRPFSSVGRRSKLTQEFTAELRKQQKQNSSSSLGKSSSSSPKMAHRRTVVVLQSSQSSASPPPADELVKPQTSSPIHDPLKTPAMAQASHTVEVQSHRNEEEDNLSDAGTYTIEADIQDKELEEARRKIDQVFGLSESPEPLYCSAAETSSAFRPVVGQGREEDRQSSCEGVRPAPEQGHDLMKVPAAGAGLLQSPKWKCCWASLADTYTESGPPSGLSDTASQMELSGEARGALSQRQDKLDADGSKARRSLPQLPGERSDAPMPSIHVHYNPNSTFEVEEKGLKPEDGIYRLTVQDDVEPDSLSDASKSDDGSIVDQFQGEKLESSVKSTSFYIGSGEEVTAQSGLNHNTPKTERKHTTKSFSTATLTKQKGAHDTGRVKPNASEPVLGHRMQSPEGKEAAVSLIRQESFTKEGPINAKLPNISAQSFQRDPDAAFFQGSTGQETHSYLKQTEDALAVLEAKLQSGHPRVTPSPIADSLSGESDIDTSSTISQQSNKTKPKTSSGFYRERSHTFGTSQDASLQSKKQRLFGSSNNKMDPAKRPVALRRSVGKRGSVDLSDDTQSLPYSDQESNNSQARTKYTVPLQKGDSKTTKASQALNRANSLSAPRPTRASMLRRARLGESDNEGMEPDKLAQEANGSSSKQPQEAKKLSRLDMLAMPRRRAGSFNTPSDTEAPSTAQWTGKSAGMSNRSTESSSSSVQRASTSGTKPIERPQKPVLSKTPLTRARSSIAKYSSSTASSRRRQKGSDYTSTSDEEYDSNWSHLKHKRSQPSSASQSSRGQPLVARHPKPHRDSEEEVQGESFHSWSAHSAEIARLSQDLAKDLAILAREIHDVAGDGDPQISEVENGATSSTAAAHEQSLESGLNHRVQPSSASRQESDLSLINHGQKSKQRAQSREEDSLDSLALNPVYQVIMAISENTEELSEKIKALFQDRIDIWEEMETKMDADGDFPDIPTSNKDMMSILKKLFSVQKQLEVINTIMGPCSTPEPPRTSASSSLGGRSSRVSSSRDWRTVHSVSKRGGGPRPGESVRRAAVTPEDLRQAYLV
ncbi:centrosomal protein of 170 kDa protein B isoform X2 [Oryzias melastigma]|nr:centrosomal protein of 170 kDa protein B isoform X2 [Oryzias melastigma]XP_024142613.1 centrosomal protein of 170 kDa protein B isoform X2 [Oryzias melastigma]XP_036065904.1 centrosomal protein of 170 kDa protein B isoform X2 [Oryzias melastigma]